MLDKMARPAEDKYSAIRQRRNRAIDLCSQRPWKKNCEHKEFNGRKKALKYWEDISDLFLRKLEAAERQRERKIRAAKGDPHLDLKPLLRGFEMKELPQHIVGRTGSVYRVLHGHSIEHIQFEPIVTSRKKGRSKVARKDRHRIAHSKFLLGEVGDSMLCRACPLIRGSEPVEGRHFCREALFSPAMIQKLRAKALETASDQMRRKIREKVAITLGPAMILARRRAQRVLLKMVKKGQRIDAETAESIVVHILEASGIMGERVDAFKAGLREIG